MTSLCTSAPRPRLQLTSNSEGRAAEEAAFQRSTDRARGIFETARPDTKYFSRMSRLIECVGYFCRMFRLNVFLCVDLKMRECILLFL